jgi:hypothetical protein
MRVLLQRELGITKSEAGALDIRNQCSGFLYGLSIADQFVKTGMYKNVLVVGSEMHSMGLDFSDRGRNVTVIFGDGAGAVVVQPSDNPEKGILTTKLHSDGTYAEKLAFINPGAHGGYHLSKMGGVRLRIPADRYIRVKFSSQKNVPGGPLLPEYGRPVRIQTGYSEISRSYSRSPEGNRTSDFGIFLCWYHTRPTCVSARWYSGRSDCATIRCGTTSRNMETRQRLLCPLRFVRPGKPARSKRAILVRSPHSEVDSPGAARSSAGKPVTYNQDLVQESLPVFANGRDPEQDLINLLFVSNKLNRRTFLQNSVLAGATGGTRSNH